MSYRDREYLRTLVAYLCKLHNLPDDVTDTATYNVLHSNVKNVSAKAKVIIIVYLTAIKNGYYVPLEVLSKSLALLSSSFLFFLTSIELYINRACFDTFCVSILCFPARLIIVPISLSVAATKKVVEKIKIKVKMVKKISYTY